MNDLKKQLAGSADFWHLIDEVNLNNRLSFAEFQVLHDAACAKLDALQRQYHHRHELEQFQQACRSLAQSIQISCLALRVADVSREERSRIREVFDYQIAHLNACLQRSFERS
ncbi:hypothetical protein D3C76_884990 [compost metagenome]